MTIIIAESGVDHEGSMDRMLQLIRAASEAGADVFKTQYYKEGLRGPNRELPRLTPDEMLEAKLYCESQNMEFLVTPHDEWALDFIVKELDCLKIKIGSGGWHLIDKALAIGKPLIVSTGMHTEEEIVDIAGKLIAQSQSPVLLHCISGYPVPPEDAQIGFIKKLRVILSPSIRVGYSDHTSDPHIALAAIGAGATVLEKHLTLELYVPGRQDTYCSLDPMEFRSFVRCIREVDAALEFHRRITPQELETKKWLDARN